jgi:hypothetical protein
MTCKCGHLATEHNLRIDFRGEFIITCMECDCKDYDRAPKEVGF